MKSNNNRLRACVAAMSAAAALAAALPLQAQTANAPIPASSTPEYRLGAGDVVRITVYQNPDLTLETRVSETGVVSYPLIGQVRLGGQSISAAERAIADGLRNGNFVKQPQVTIAVLQVRGNQANVLGQVNRPGRYPLEVAEMRLTDLLAMAGGTAVSGGDVIIVTGSRNGRPFRAEVDVPTIFSANSNTEDILIQNGDVIWVERQPTVYIYGEVQRPGPMRLERGMTLMQALATGGGLTQRGTEKGIRVHRRSVDGKTEIITPTMDDRMKDGDVIYVRESLF
ncbi:polysaccharide export protein EpsE [Aquincola sp. J276]|uniref:polysaccharide export protein EpsE n=1 Tax=Aquincola sp. J276 TaxID=2898432 RepID=UPI002151D49E|nr:polysaccharide export protein EpsE [Aquincola sp. J276]MCR5866782.1 polysaccharide export protein EpsE [Aquincola sp. J276]